MGLIDELRRRHPELDPARLDDLLLGVVTPVGEQGADIAKTAALAAGLPDGACRRPQRTARARPRRADPPALQKYHWLERRDLRYGLCALCVGGGMGIATIIERMRE